MNITPRYRVSLPIFDKNCRAVMDPFGEKWGKNFVCAYSVKTNRDEKLIRYAYDVLGWKVEVVSEDEYNYVCGLGIDKQRIIFNGPYKGDALFDALQNGAIVNLDSIDEVERVCNYILSVKDIELISRIKTAIVGIRVNYDIKDDCLGELSANNNYSRFGICYENGDFIEAINILSSVGIPLSGIHVHYSTKTRSLNVFDVISSRIAESVSKYCLDLQYVDIGGGFFGGQQLDGKPTMDEYSRIISTNLKKAIDENNTTLILEPGASVIATTTQYICKVVSTKDIGGLRIVTVDGTLLHINPFMREREPKYSVTKKKADANRKNYTEQIICGSTCMENDRFFSIFDDEELIVGDEVIFDYSGAYTMAFNSHFIIEIPKIEYIK